MYELEWKYSGEHLQIYPFWVWTSVLEFMVSVGRSHRLNNFVIVIGIAIMVSIISSLIKYIFFPTFHQLGMNR